MLLIKSISNMEVAVTLPGGGIKSFDSTPADSIESLKRKIEQKEGIPVHKQTLFYGDFILRNDHQLQDYYIHRNSTVDLLVLFCLVVFLPYGKPVQIESDSDERIRSLKIRIARKFGIPVASQKIFYQSQEMADYLTLADYKIYDDATLFLERVYIKRASSKFYKDSTWNLPI